MLKENEIINGKQYRFKTDYSDYGDIGCYDCVITIIRPLEDGIEIDKADVGPMFLAKSENGYYLNVYLDELSSLK